VPVATQGSERPGRGKCLEIAAIEPGARGELRHAGEGPQRAHGDQALGAGL